MKNTYWKSGEWNAICDLCGFQFKSGQLRENWKGQMVCRKDWEPRHPQEIARPAPRGEAAIPWSRPESDYTEHTGDGADL